MTTSSQLSQNTDSVIFEYPLQENIRSFLKLESLFAQIRRNIQVDNCDNHLHALKLLFEILEILERGDTRSEITKELSRLLLYFQELESYPEVDTSKLEQFLKQINQIHQWVHSYQGKFGESIRKDPFIESVKYRCAIPGGNCQFDCPDLFLFMQQSNEYRQTQLNGWLNKIKGVETSVEVILRLIRDKGDWESQKAPFGSFMIETSDKSYKMLRIKGMSNQAFFPELSSGKHRSNIHFMQYTQEHKKMPANAEVTFELACCR